MLASGPYLTPEVALTLLSVFACPALAIGLLVTSLITFRRRRQVFATLCIVLSLLFLAALIVPWVFHLESRAFLASFGAVFVVAILAFVFYFATYARRKV